MAGALVGIFSDQKATMSLRRNHRLETKQDATDTYSIYIQDSRRMKASWPPSAQYYFPFLLGICLAFYPILALLLGKYRQERDSIFVEWMGEESRVVSFLDFMSIWILDWSPRLAAKLLSAHIVLLLCFVGIQRRQGTKEKVN